MDFNWIRERKKPRNISLNAHAWQHLRSFSFSQLCYLSFSPISFRPTSPYRVSIFNNALLIWHQSWNIIFRFSEYSHSKLSFLFIRHSVFLSLSSLVFIALHFFFLSFFRLQFFLSCNFHFPVFCLTVFWFIFILCSFYHYFFLSFFA